LFILDRTPDLPSGPACNPRDCPPVVNFLTDGPSGADGINTLVEATRVGLMRDMQTLELLRQYLQTRVSIDSARITPDAKLQDIGVDSLILIDLMLELEDSLNVRVPDVDTRPETVAELTNLFDSLTTAQLKTGT
jgi:acyl carrier protein